MEIGFGNHNFLDFKKLKKIARLFGASKLSILQYIDII
jgi:hypothetical protein